MKNFLPFLLCLLIIMACNETPMETYVKQIDALTTIELQKDFLEGIDSVDQKVRHDETDIKLIHGYKSKEHNKAMILMMVTDKENLILIEAYLEKYGYPTIDQHGKQACAAPWIVIHHAIGGVIPRERNFKYLYKAYKTEDLKGGHFTFYLNRMYHIKSGARIKLNNPYTESFEIDTLVQSLNLEHLVKEVDSELNNSGKLE